MSLTLFPNLQFLLGLRNKKTSNGIFNLINEKYVPSQTVAHTINEWAQNFRLCLTTPFQKYLSFDSLSHLRWEFL